MGVIPPGEVEKPFVIFFLFLSHLLFPSSVLLYLYLSFLSLVPIPPSQSGFPLVVDHRGASFSAEFCFVFGFFTHFLLPHIIIVSP